MHDMCLHVWYLHTRMICAVYIYFSILLGVTRKNLYLYAHIG